MTALVTFTLLRILLSNTEKQAGNETNLNRQSYKSSFSGTQLTTRDAFRDKEKRKHSPMEVLKNSFFNIKLSIFFQKKTKVLLFKKRRNKNEKHEINYKL